MGEQAGGLPAAATCSCQSSCLLLRSRDGWALQFDTWWPCRRGTPCHEEAPRLLRAGSPGCTVQHALAFGLTLLHTAGVT